MKLLKCRYCSKLFVKKEGTHLLDFCSNLCRRKYCIGLISKEQNLCRKCRQIQPLGDFSKSGTNIGGYNIYCRQCQKNKFHQWRNKPGIRENLIEKKRVYRRTPEGIAKERARKQSEEFRNRRNARDKARKETDLMFKLHQQMRAAIHASLHGNKNGRSWESLVGYTLNDLKKHLEKKFDEGMNWDNYGKWHIDHIIPKSAFNFVSSEDIDFRRCWDLKNLQPLWAKENFIKNARLVEPFQPALAGL